MDNTLNFWLSIIVISVVGTLAHFLYDWSRQNRVLGLFAAVNESTWEHIKIALTASILWGFYDGYIYGQNPNYFLAKLTSFGVIIFFIPFVFYSYQRLTKHPVLPIDIATFILAITLGQLAFYAILGAPAIPYFAQYLSCIGIFLFFGCYMTLTLAPVRSVIFKDPITGKYGFRAHRDFFKSLKKHKNTPKTQHEK